VAVSMKTSTGHAKITYLPLLFLSPDARWRVGPLPPLADARAPHVSFSFNPISFPHRASPPWASSLPKRRTLEGPRSSLLCPSDCAVGSTAPHLAVRASPPTGSAPSSQLGGGGEATMTTASARGQATTCRSRLRREHPRDRRVVVVPARRNSPPTPTSVSQDQSESSSCVSSPDSASTNPSAASLPSRVGVEASRPGRRGPGSSGSGGPSPLMLSRRERYRGVVAPREWNARRAHSHGGSIAPILAVARADGEAEAQARPRR